ncbi:MAG: 3D domain-containing protein [Chloroflexota bacterium]|nr:3D domain-containing protein [Chloroflexota bacterium]
MSLLSLWGNTIARGVGDVEAPLPLERVAAELAARGDLLRRVAGALPRAGGVLLARFHPAAPDASPTWAVVEVDGKALRAASGIANVPLALAGAGVRLAEDDRVLVLPPEVAPAAGIAGGSRRTLGGRIVVQRAVPFSVEDSGVPIGLRAAAPTVGEALRAAGIDLDGADVLYPAREAPLLPGMKVAILRAAPVALHFDDRQVEAKTRAATVGDLLAERDIRLGPLDRVQPPLEDPVPVRGTVRVVRVREEARQELELVPFRSRQYYDPHLPPGARVRTQEGLSGLLEQVVDVTYEDGAEITRLPREKIITRQPVDEVIAVGPLRAIVAPVVPTAESIPSPAPPKPDAPLLPIPVPQLPDGAAVRRAMTVVATAYDPGPVSTGKSPGHPAYGITATGMRADRGVIAVDPRVIPFRTRLYVPDYGYAIAGDTGGAIKGNRIDVYFPTYAEAVRWGRRTITVYILE